ncbi:GntR family transcriptional regulator [Acrocarpospora phusangensis]|uniref:GntR family transcriptional regulator n=1 Tax=Acrocarpospora phusangensis TaxID=1070424 RepID=UPI001952360C|nr:winged helix-turn-helix domain-containing protein [Acrocarpospora phusangensis]
MTVDRTAYEPMYRQVARILQERIDEGAYLPGELLPSERELAIGMGASKDTIRDGLKVLRARGRVVTVKGVGTKVAARHEVQEHQIPPGAKVTARMPSRAERRRFNIPEGIPVLVVESAGEQVVLPADRAVLRGSEESETRRES